jgi:methylated-DNA-[protein]-cysteine S-methyltransferase
MGKNVSGKRKVYQLARVETDWGWVGLVGSDAGLRELTFPVKRADDLLEQLTSAAPGELQIDDSAFPEVVEQIKRYFRGERVNFTLVLDPDVGTEFQRRVWDALNAIPYGQTRSYSEIAHIIGHPGAARAVGNACGANQIPIMIPCHRVLTANGAIGGFGGGLEMKRMLLEREGITLA